VFVDVVYDLLVECTSTGQGAEMSLNPRKGAADARLSRLMKYLAMDPSNLLLRRDALREACRLNAWDTLKQLVDQGLMGTPGDTSLLAWQGFSNLQLKQFDQAEAALSEAMAQGLEPAEIRYNLAIAHFLQRNFASALMQLSAPLLPFELPGALLLRARCQHALARPKDAIDSVVVVRVQSSSPGGGPHANRLEHRSDAA
jgi:tetratricopeptide (TPR) repeat protein